jgi:hypothetical protein
VTPCRLVLYNSHNHGLVIHANMDELCHCRSALAQLANIHGALIHKFRNPYLLAHNRHTFAFSVAHLHTVRADLRTVSLLA